MSHSVVLFLLVFAPALAMVLALLGLEPLEKNMLGWLGLAMGVGYPSGAVIHFWLRKEPLWEIQPRKDLNAEERGVTSFWIVLPGLVAIFFAPPLEYLYLPAYMPRADWMELMGLALILLGAACYFRARAALKAGNSGHGFVTPGHKLVQNGPYRCIRHPGYTGYFLMALGFCLGYSSVIGLAAILILLLPGFAYRMNVEDKFLEATFADEYREYARRKKRILPGIW